MSAATAKMATTASPLTPTAIPSASSNASSRDPSRPSRPPQPRPTTYSGIAPTTSSAQNGSVPQAPLAIPPRTSSQRQVPTASSAAPSSSSSENRGERSKSVNAGRPGGTSERRGDRDRERDRERERDGTETGRTRRAPANSQPTPASASDGQRRNSTSTRERAPDDPNRKTANGTSREHSSRNRGEGSSSQSRNGPSATEQTPAHRSGNESEKKEPRPRKETRFGEYILGQTLGEGEFGKVKLGWRRDGGVQVAIKLIRRDTLTPHPNRLSKIYREISILRTLSHPNIVKLHEMVETEKHIGIILEYASGGELFDFILTHRFLKDPPACRLFAQLVSGVGYLHKKGIVHRDLKLENLLLDRNRNIIITDFGFANVFDPNDELGEELESKLNDPEALKELEKGVIVAENAGGIYSELGLRGTLRKRGDLMATSCGSPCYAAPELVVSDGLYTGRKVDVWSCGVILYAMLAGYLPFDDDPANPEGDNINLLYKYIVSTPLTFPEYVTPHARDLLRRILVPDPRQRADLFEVARHSWLAPFANVVGAITSSTTTEKDIANTTVGDELTAEVPLLTRSASVREPSTTTSGHPHATVLGGLGPRHGHVEHTPQPAQEKPPGDNKRRTVQVEYVAPKSQTKRGESSGTVAQASQTVRSGTELEPRPTKEDHPAPREVLAPRPDAGLARAATTAGTSRHATGERPATVSVKPAQTEGGSSKLPVPLSRIRPASYQHQPTAAAAIPSSSTAGQGAQPQRRDSTKDRKHPPISGTNKPLPPQGSSTRPSTGNSAESSNRLPSRGGSYSRPSGPAAPSLQTASAQGRLQQPKSGKPYTISNPIPIPDNTQNISSVGMPSTQPVPPVKSNRPSTQEQIQTKDKGHKRANTVTGSGGIFGRFTNPPPTANNQEAGDGDKTESQDSIEQGTGSAKNAKAQQAKTRRFSLLPPNFSFRGFTVSSSESKKGHERRPSRSASGNSVQQRRWDTQQQQQVVGGGSSYPQLGTSNASQPVGPHSHSGSESSLAMGASAPPTSTTANFPSSPNPDLNAEIGRKGSHSPDLSQSGNSGPLLSGTAVASQGGVRGSSEGNAVRRRPTVLTKPRKFTEAYEEGAAGSGSSGAARRVMDFFRRRGAARTKS